MTKRELMIRYLKLKVDEEDWHGVADAAMDLREIDAEARARQPTVAVDPNGPGGEEWWRLYKDRF